VFNFSRIDLTGTHVGFARPGTRWRHWTTDSVIPVRLRAFRKVAEDTKNHDLERDLYIEERKAERGVYWRQLSGLDGLETKLKEISEQKKHVWLEWRLKRRARNARWLGLLAKPTQLMWLIAHCLWIGIMGIYWVLANYGRSFARPIGWLIASGFFFYWCYGGIFAPLAPNACPIADKYDHAVRMLALGNTVPFVGPLTIDSEIKKFLFCPLNNCPNPIIPPEGYQLAVLSQNLLSIILVFFIGLALRNYFKIK
jgi:hypothetical protein